MIYTTIDSRLQAAANQAVQRQMDALQAVADVEWGMSSAAVDFVGVRTSTSISAGVCSLSVISGKPRPT